MMSKSAKSFSNLLTSEVYKKSLERIHSGVPSSDLLAGMTVAVKTAVYEIRKGSKVPKEETDISRIALSAADFDLDIGRLISQATADAGFITLQKSVGIESSVARYKGIRFSGGYLSREFLTDANQCILVNPSVLVCDRRISVFKELAPLLEDLAFRGLPILIAAREFDASTLAGLVGMSMQGSLRCCAIKPASKVDERHDWMEDLATLTNSRILREGEKTPISVGDLGKAERIIIDADSATVMVGQHVLDAISSKRDPETGGREVDLFLHEGVGRMAKPVTVVEIGAHGKKRPSGQIRLAKNALSAVRTARETGYVPNLKNALINAQSAVADLSLAGAAQEGANLISEVLFNLSSKEYLSSRGVKPRLLMASLPTEMTIKTLTHPLKNIRSKLATYTLQDAGIDPKIENLLANETEPPTPPNDSEPLPHKRDTEGSENLYISHWFEDGSGNTLPMETQLLDGSRYFYGFQIDRDAHGNATAEHFVPPPELEKNKATFVFVEVSCELMQPAVQKRRLRYVRGVGTDEQYFELSTRVGSFSLTVTMVHCNRMVYCQPWKITVVAEVKAATGKALEQEVAPKRILSNRTSVADLQSSGAQDPYRLTVNKARFDLDPPGATTVSGSPPSEAALIGQTLDLRGQLSRFAKHWVPDTILGADAWLNFLLQMADWGNQTCKILFQGVQNETILRIMEKIPIGYPVHINSEFPCLPWEWLYLGKVPGKEEVAAKLDDFLEGFWGTRFELDIMALTTTNRTAAICTLENSDETVLLAAVNPTAFPVAADNLKYFENLKETLGQRSLVCSRGSNEAKIALKRALEDFNYAPHLLYIYGHHKAAPQITNQGYLSFDKKSIIYLKDETSEPISVEDLLQSDFSPFRCRSPLVILNACSTAQGEEYYRSGFIHYFASELAAAAVIGSLAEIPAADAYEFARTFVDRWLGGARAAQVLRRIRFEWLKNKNNPFAMYYTLHGSGYLSLNKPIEVKKGAA